MTLKKGKSKEVMAENLVELHQGPQYHRTMKKFGKETADKQAVAIALKQQRKSK